MSSKRLPHEKAPERPRSKSGLARRAAKSASKNNALATTGSHDQEDVALICGKTPDGEGLHILRKRRGSVEAGVARPLREGRPIDGDVVRLRPRAELPLLCDVEVELEMLRPELPEREPERFDSSGPPQVATDDYRRNWDLIWSRSASKDRTVN